MGLNPNGNTIKRITDIMIEQLKKLYPKWIPYPISWLRTLVLILVLGPTGSLISVLGLWGSFGTILGGSSGDIPLPDVLILLAIAALVLLLPTTILAYVYHVFALIIDAKSISAQHPRGFPTWRSWREGLTGIIVMGLSLTISVFVVLWYRPDLIGNPDLVTQSDKEEIATFLGIVWLISAAYLYQWDYLVRKKRTRKQKKRKSSSVAIETKSPPQPRVDEIDIELNKLRGEMGIHQIKKYPSRK
jgi:hypothetical protein